MWHSPRKKTRKDIKPIPRAKEKTNVSDLFRTFVKLKTNSSLWPINSAKEINNINRINTFK
tara:strand:- start:401 stop:583 length:183 start_codon:yes stop_codon:yes gene_type:complete